MPFVNERIVPDSAEAERLGLPALMKRFSQLPGVYYYITIDREQDAMLTKISRADRDDPSSYGKQLFFLRSKGDAATVYLEKDPMAPFPTVRWRQLGVSIEQGSKFNAERAITILKEALAVFGMTGSRNDIAQNKVSFDF